MAYTGNASFESDKRQLQALNPRLVIWSDTVDDASLHKRLKQILEGHLPPEQLLYGLEKAVDCFKKQDIKFDLSSASVTALSEISSSAPKQDKAWRRAQSDAVSHTELLAGCRQGYDAILDNITMPEPPLAGH